MNYAVKEAMRKWQQEVDAEMIRLIESGVPPYEAADRARDIVSRRRASRRDEGRAK